MEGVLFILFKFPTVTWSWQSHYTRGSGCNQDVCRAPSQGDGPLTGHASYSHTLTLLRSRTENTSKFRSDMGQSDADRPVSTCPGGLNVLQTPTGPVGLMAPEREADVSSRGLQCAQTHIRLTSRSVSLLVTSICGYAN